MKIAITHKGYDWIIQVIDYDYEEEVIQTHNEQGFPESAHITGGYLQLAGEGYLAASINTQLAERGDGALFNMLVELNQDVIADKLLEAIHVSGESQERDYAGELEESEADRREEFKNKEVVV